MPPPSDGSSSDPASRWGGAVFWSPGADDDAADASAANDSGWERHGTALREWDDLESATRRVSSARDNTVLRDVSTGWFALVILLIAGVFTLYVGHVHATSDLYTQLQQARTTNQQLHLKHNRLEGAYDRRTGPSVIYERARALGLRESVAYGPPVHVE
jgi:hypothetical protein